MCLLDMIIRYECFLDEILFFFISNWEKVTKTIFGFKKKMVQINTIDVVQGKLVFKESKATLFIVK